MSNRPLVLALATMATGCGLIDSNVLDFPLNINPRTFLVDTSNWMVSQQDADAATNTSCASAPTVCATAAQQACTADCTATCDATTKTCDLQLQVGLYSMVDLNMDQSELASIDKTKGISVVIDSAEYAVTANTLSVATPPMTIYLAPAIVMDPSDPMAMAIGTIDPVPAQTAVDDTAITYTPDGKHLLNGAMTDFSAPFNLLVGATLEVGKNATVPTGQLTATVKVLAHAHAL